MRVEEEKAAGERRAEERANDRERAIAQGFAAWPCVICENHTLAQIGRCYTCQSCGSTTGCG